MIYAYDSSSLDVDPDEVAQQAFEQRPSISCTSSCRGCNDPQCGCYDREQEAIERVTSKIWNDEERVNDLLIARLEAEPPSLALCDHTNPADALATCLLILREAYRPLNNLPFANTEDAMRNLRILAFDAMKLAEQVVNDEAMRELGLAA